MSDWFSDILIEYPLEEDDTDDPLEGASIKTVGGKGGSSTKRKRRPKPHRSSKAEDTLHRPGKRSLPVTEKEDSRVALLSDRELSEIEKGAETLSRVFLETLNDWIGYRDQALPPEVAKVLLDVFADEVALGGYLPEETEGIYYSGDRFVFPEEVRSDMEEHFSTTLESGKSLGDLRYEQIDRYKVAKISRERGHGEQSFDFGKDPFRTKKHQKTYRLEPIKDREERLKELSRKTREKETAKAMGRFDEQIPPEYLNYRYERLIANPEISRNTRADIEEFISETLVKREAIKNLKFQFLTVYGSRVGTGKTTLGVAIAREIVKRTGSTAAFIQATDFMSRASFDYEELVKELDASRVLLIDDLGVTVQDMTQRQRDTLSKVIDSRWSNPDKVTIITTNLPPVGTSVKMGLSDYFGKASWSRFSDNMLMIELNKGSYRGAGRERKVDEA